MDSRVRKRREFFQVDPERVRSALMLTEGKEVSIDKSKSVKELSDLVSISSVAGRRPQFKFSMVDLAPGTKLTHTHDENAVCIVEDDSHVRFEKTVMSLSKSAGIVLERLGLSPQVAGTNYWMYKGKRLWELRTD